MTLLPWSLYFWSRPKIVAKPPQWQDPLLKSYLFSTVMKCFLGSLKDKKQGFFILGLQRLGEEHSRKREHMCAGPKQGMWLLQRTYPWAREQYKNRLDGRSVTDHIGPSKAMRILDITLEYWVAFKDWIEWLNQTCVSKRSLLLLRRID